MGTPTAEESRALLARIEQGPTALRAYAYDLRKHLRAALDREAAALARAEKTEREARVAVNLKEAAKQRVIDLKAERDAAQAEVDRLSKPDIFWWAEDGEYSYRSPEEALDDAPIDGLINLDCAKSLPSIWAATACLTVDAEGNPDETGVRLFSNEIDAERCWPESLAACSAALTKEDK